MKVTVNIEYNSDDPEDLAKAKKMIESEANYNALWELKHNLRRKFEHLTGEMSADELLDKIMEEIWLQTEEI